MNIKLYCINPSTKEYEEVKTIYGINIEEILDLIRDYKMSKDLKFDKFGKLEEIARLEEENERYRIALNEMAMIICKAIEYIEELKNLYDDNYTISDKASDILEILRGDKEW